jgi:hypothetical protein
MGSIRPYPSTLLFFKTLKRSMGVLEQYSPFQARLMALIWLVFGSAENERSRREI